jgi:hypothetical protein
VRIFLYTVGLAILMIVAGLAGFLIGIYWG